MNAKPSVEGHTILVKNGEAQEIPPLRNYLCLTMFTCFCPAWPINIVALVFSVMVSFFTCPMFLISWTTFCDGNRDHTKYYRCHAQRSYDEEDYDGSQRLGRKALHLGLVSFVIGLVIITAYIVVHFTTHVI